MTVLTSLSNAHRDATTTAANSLYRANGRSWGSVNPNNIVATWQQQLPTVVRNVAQTQEFVTIDAAAFNAVALAVQGKDVDVFVDPDDHIGAMPYSGADLASAFAGPAYRALDAIKAGRTVDQAMLSGMADVARLTSNTAFDTAEETTITQAVADMTAYQRMPQVGCCIRCSMLTGEYFTTKVFKRHPHCRCVYVPILEPANAPMRSNDAYELFNALTESEQNRIWTKAGAQAIRDGADIFQVGNSITRGLNGRRLGKFTSEGASKRSWYRKLSPAGRAGKRRLSVSEIYRRAAGNPDAAKKLLIDYGYLLGPQDPAGLNAGAHMRGAGAKWAKQKVINAWRAKHGLYNRSVREPQPWDFNPSNAPLMRSATATSAEVPLAQRSSSFRAEVEASAKRVADVTVGRIMRRQQLFETRFAAYAAVAAAEGGKRVFPKPSPGPPRKTIAQEQASKPPQAAAGGAGRGGGQKPPAPPANGGYPDDWDKPMEINGVILPFAAARIPTELTEGEVQHVIDGHLAPKDKNKSPIPKSWGRDPEFIKMKLEQVLDQVRVAPLSAKVRLKAVEIEARFEGKTWRVVFHNSVEPGVIAMHTL